MAGRRSFKSEESFLKKISIGAVGTKKTFEDLFIQGHEPLELERGSMSFKIWKEIKIKRVRVPDILCVKCGKRIESRAKTKMSLTMSHSVSNPERGWDFGLDDGDFIAFTKCKKTGERPIDWKASDFVQYAPVKDMKSAFDKDHVKIEKPKGATEGFETRITWPSSIASSDGKIINIDKSKIQFKRKGDGRKITLQLRKKGINLFPLVKVNDKINEGQVLASVMPVKRKFECEKSASKDTYIQMLGSSSLSDRYAAAKALSHFTSKKAVEKLSLKINDKKEHIYVRLEAASSLFKLGDKRGLKFIQKILNDEYLENRLEAVIILGEIKSDDSCELLIKTLLDKSQHPEIRAGSAWSLGELKNRKAMEALVEVFNEIKPNIRNEAARSLMKFGNDYSEDIINFLPESNEKERAGIAWALSNSSNFSIKDLFPAMVDDEARKWIAWIIGNQDEEKYIRQIEDLKKKDREVYFTVTVMWKILSSWINGLDIY